ncbi:hypothetical protein Pr1d_49890 [Bythopirellula goksoeyrii]|uniref:Uncharacterized protein n=1 Tax=Bythopirellula goksoeyrii TaxID=1400387 RepID=A0A5B9QUP8_9BACT|nr:hypothetical protein Pr1d_49890 [Bythopirellula goksoeyrii]
MLLVNKSTSPLGFKPKKKARTPRTAAIAGPWRTRIEFIITPFYFRLMYSHSSQTSLKAQRTRRRRVSQSRNSCVFSANLCALAHSALNSSIRGLSSLAFYHRGAASRRAGHGTCFPSHGLWPRPGLNHAYSTNSSTGKLFSLTISSAERSLFASHHLAYPSWLLAKFGSPCISR